jgi:hypothetical protein
MAKPKTEQPATPKRRGRPASLNPKVSAPIGITIRAKPEWITWIDGLGDAMKREAGLSINFSRTDVIDTALARAAKSLGHPDPPQRY